jgi:hypothetical protein
MLAGAVLWGGASAADAQLSATLSSGFNSSAGPVFAGPAIKPRFDIPFGDNLTVAAWYGVGLNKGTVGLNMVSRDSLYEQGVSVMAHGQLLRIGDSDRFLLDAGVQNWNYNPNGGFYHNIYVAGGTLAYSGVIDARATLFRAMWGGAIDTQFNKMTPESVKMGPLWKTIFKNRERMLGVDVSKQITLIGSADRDSAKIALVPGVGWGYSKMLGVYDTEYREALVTLILETGAIEFDFVAKERIQTVGGKFSELAVSVTL